MGLLAKLFSPSKGGEFALPLGAYYAARAVYAMQGLAVWMSRWESRRVRKRLGAELAVDRPIYVTGCARSGTTVSIEMLSQHPAVATHRYHQMVNPFWPYWWERLVNVIPLPDETPVERVHKDGVMVVRDSPEALEEPSWTYFFKHLHDESRSCVLDGSTSNPAFERYYREHMAKLVASQPGATRYAAKNNYNLTRMEYLLKQNPDARFLLYIRNPVNHIASLMKQDRLFMDMGQRTLKMTKLIGHHEFGADKLCINVGNPDRVREIRSLWAEGHAVRGWALYWSDLYDYAARRLEENKALREATLVVRYEELCEHSDAMISRILDHVGLEHAPFEQARAHYTEKLRPPRYYNPSFSEGELDDVAELCGETASRFGYRPSENEVRFEPRPAAELH